MKQRAILMGVLSMLLCVGGAPVKVRAVGADDKPRVMIAEVSPESSKAAGEEYVQLYNPGDQSVDITGWELQYRSASHAPSDVTGWATKAIIGCQTVNEAACQDDALEAVDVSSKSSVWLSSYDIHQDVLPLQSGMATTGGQIRLVQPGVDDTGRQTVQTYDMVGYGTAKAYEGSAPATAPKAGHSIVRLKADDAFQDSDDNIKDFVLSPDVSAVSEDGGSVVEAPGQGAGGDHYLAPEITELLPDPASPQVDTADEFIELYNPYDEPIDLDGYALVSGATWSHKYTIQDTVIDPHGYIAFMSSETHISLSNSGSGVRLMDPNGTVLFEVPSYGKALTGDSWVRDMGGHWVWTTEPTPGVANILASPPAKIAATPAVKKTASKAKTTSSKAKKASSSKTVAAKAPGAGEGAATKTPQQSHMNYMILAFAAVAAGGYVLFEYRQDIALYARRAWLAVWGRGGE